MLQQVWNWETRTWGKKIENTQQQQQEPVELDLKVFKCSHYGEHV